MKLINLLKTSWGRLGAGVAALLSLAWLNDAQFTGVVEWEPTGVFVLALMAWFISCFPDEEVRIPPPKDGPALPAGTPGLSNHDRSLFDRFRGLFDTNLRLFLSEQDMAAAFDISRLDPLREIAATWKGPDFEFDDPELQASFGELLSRIRDTSSAIALGTQMLNDRFAKMPWKHDDDAGSRARQKALNDLADALTSAFDDFVRQYRIRISEVQDSRT